MNNQLQNGSRGLITEPFAKLVPTRPAKAALTLCGMLSGSPHLFTYNIQGLLQLLQQKTKKLQFRAAEDNKLYSLNITPVWLYHFSN